jgi:hypothetical protein
MLKDADDEFSGIPSDAAFLQMEKGIGGKECKISQREYTTS